MTNSSYLVPGEFKISTKKLALFRGTGRREDSSVSFSSAYLGSLSGFYDEISVFCFSLETRFDTLAPMSLIFLFGWRYVCTSSWDVF